MTSPAGIYLFPRYPWHEVSRGAHVVDNIIYMFERVVVLQPREPMQDIANVTLYLLSGVILMTQHSIASLP